MGRIRSKNTKPELLLRKALWAKGVRYRLRSKLPGKPDMAIKKYKLAIFVDGEFWHGYNWDERKPKVKTNRGFWVPKIERNIQRDQEVNKQLEEMGYTVFRFWSRELKENLQTCVQDLLHFINTGQMT